MMMGSNISWVVGGRRSRYLVSARGRLLVILSPTSLCRRVDGSYKPSIYNKVGQTPKDESPRRLLAIDRLDIRQCTVKATGRAKKCPPVIWVRNA